MGGIFGSLLDFVGRMVGVWMLYAVLIDYIPPVIHRLTGKRDLPLRLQKPLGHVTHIGAMIVGWWLLSH